MSGRSHNVGRENAVPPSPRGSVPPEGDGNIAPRDEFDGSHADKLQLGADSLTIVVKA